MHITYMEPLGQVVCPGMRHLDLKLMNMHNLSHPEKRREKKIYGNNLFHGENFVLYPNEKLLPTFCVQV